MKPLFCRLVNCLKKSVFYYWKSESLYFSHANKIKQFLFEKEKKFYFINNFYFYLLKNVWTALKLNPTGPFIGSKI